MRGFRIDIYGAAYNQVARSSREGAGKALGVGWLVADHVYHDIKRPCRAHRGFEYGVFAAVADYLPHSFRQICFPFSTIKDRDLMTALL